MSITNNERTRICFRNLIEFDLKAFRNNIFERFPNDATFYQNCLIELYSSALYYKKSENLVFDMANSGKTKNDAYLDFFNENELRRIALAFYYFSCDFKNNDIYFNLSKQDISAMIQKAVKKSQAKILNEKTDRQNIKPIIKLFNNSIKQNGFTLAGDVYTEKSSEEKEKEFKKALKDYKLALNDFKFVLEDFDSAQIAFVFQNLNKGFYASNFGKSFVVEPSSIIQSGQEDMLSAKFLRMHTFKFNRFIKEYKEQELSIDNTSIKTLACIAENVGESVRDSIYELYGKYPEFTNEFSDLFFVNAINQSNKQNENKNEKKDDVILL